MKTDFVTKEELENAINLNDISMEDRESTTISLPYELPDYENGVVDGIAECAHNNNLDLIVIEYLPWNYPTDYSFLDGGNMCLNCMTYDVRTGIEKEAVIEQSEIYPVFDDNACLLAVYTPDAIFTPLSRDEVETAFDDVARQVESIDWD